MKTKKIIVPICVFIFLILIVLIRIFLISSAKFKAYQIGQELCGSTSWWKDHITYEMLSDDIRSVVSEEEFNGDRETLLQTYQKLEEVRFSEKEHFPGSTYHWKSDPVPHIITDESGQEYCIDYDFDFDVNTLAIIPKVEVVNFTCHIFEFKDDDESIDE